jgi:hypothetical protein
MGLRVTYLKGGKIPLWRAFLRYISYYISGVFLGLGFLWIIIDNRRMGWHDKLAGTCVIYTWEARPDERFLKNAMRVLSSRREAMNQLKHQQNNLKRMLAKQKDTFAKNPPPDMDSN